jgi:predicted ABC-type ATPase
MLQEIDRLVAARAEFMFETTLASLTYATRVPEWRAGGYYVGLVYLRLPNVEASIARVRRRVEAGGHGIPEEIIRRRFFRSLECLEQRYKRVVDEWYIYDSLEGDFRLAETSRAIKSKKLSEPKVRAALKGAAHDAVHGSRDARSGRFLTGAQAENKQTTIRTERLPPKKS